MASQNQLPLKPSSSSPQSVRNISRVELERVLGSAAMEDRRTVIVTMVNAAWTEPGSLFDLFLESFVGGNQTQTLLKHLVVAAVDRKAYSRCLEIHSHCYPLESHGVDFSRHAKLMSSMYRKMMWARINFLLSILEIGYDFIFTDVDILWMRNPMPRLMDPGDLQMACDSYEFGNSASLENYPNAGFMYVKSNGRTIEFFKFWYNSRLAYRKKNEQQVFTIIKFDPVVPRIGLQIRFLDTYYFGGFCDPRMDVDLDALVTMHANCCVGLEKKLNILRIVLADWKNYLHAAEEGGREMMTMESRRKSWSGPWLC